MDDLMRDRLTTDLRQASRIMAETGTFEIGQGLLNDAADEIERLRSLVSFHEDQKRQSEATRETAIRRAYPNLFSELGGTSKPGEGQSDD